MLNATCETFSWDSNELCQHKDLIPLDYTDFILGLTIFFINIFTTIAGIGGGTIFTPLFILIGNFNVQNAIPLSIITIIGNGLGRVIYLYNRRIHLNPNKYLINYELLLQIIPFNASLAFVGFLLNTISPSWLVMLFILITIGTLIYNVSRKIYNQYKIDMKDDNKIVFIDGIAYALLYRNIEVDGIEQCVNEEVYNNVMNSTLETSKKKYLYTFLLSFICLLLFVFSIIRTFIEYYWIMYIVQFIVFALISISVSIYNYKYDKLPKKEIVIYSSVSTLTGIVSTYIGIGGGLIINPFLLYMGQSIDVVTGTVSMYTLFSSLSSISQYIFTDKIFIYYSIYFFLIGFVSSLIGIKLFDLIFKKYNKKYILLCILLGLITISFSLTLVIGIRDIILEYD